MRINVGVKVWSSNHELFPLAVELQQQKLIYCVEVYTVPGAIELQALRPLQNLPAFVHAPHENHHFNVHQLDQTMVDFFRNTVVPTADFLHARGIVIHTGIGTNIDTFVRQYKSINDPRIIIENMPRVALGGGTCFGYSLDQLTAVQRLVQRPFCIDIGHAIKSALAQQIEYKEFLTALCAQLRPAYFHISDGRLDNLEDDHLGLGQGNYDLPWIKKLIEEWATRSDVTVIFEVPKKGETFDNDLASIRYWHQL